MLARCCSGTDVSDTRVYVARFGVLVCLSPCVVEVTTCGTTFVFSSLDKAVRTVIEGASGLFYTCELLDRVRLMQGAHRPYLVVASLHPSRGWHGSGLQAGIGCLSLENLTAVHERSLRVDLTRPSIHIQSLIQIQRARVKGIHRDSWIAGITSFGHGRRHRDRCLRLDELGSST